MKDGGAKAGGDGLVDDLDLRLFEEGISSFECGGWFLDVGGRWTERVDGDISICHWRLNDRQGSDNVAVGVAKLE